MLIVASKPGRLGNRLFAFAHFIAYSLRTGQTIWNPAFDEYADYFVGTRDVAIPRFPPPAHKLRAAPGLRRLIYGLSYACARAAWRCPIPLPFARTVHLDWADSLDLSAPGTIDLLARPGLTFVQGWLFQDLEGLARQRETILSFLRPIERHESRARECVAWARQHCAVLVGVHVRQGDYRSFEGGRYFYQTGDYLRVLERLRSYFGEKDVGFLICSNVAYEPGAWGSVRHFPGPGQPLEDLLSLSLCDYLVGPPSTFSMWASFSGQVPLFMLRSLAEEPAFRVVCASPANSPEPGDTA